MVGADEADELDLAALGPAGGELVERDAACAACSGWASLGRQAARRAVAVLGVVEALERARALGQVRDDR